MPLLAGAARVDITPRLGCHLDGHFNDRTSDDIHDQLQAKALVLENRGTRLGIVLCDVIVLPQETADAIKSEVSERVGIDPANLLVTATHTHSGPATFGAFNTVREDGYLAELPRRVTDAVAMAADRLEPAELAWAFDECRSEVFNRRWRLKDGTVRMNPGVLNPELVEPAGPIDPTLSVLIVRNAERQPLAVVGNLALHYVGVPGNTISADYFGVFATALQAFAGAEFVAMLTNGCFGDINNVDVTRAASPPPYPYHRIERVGNVVAGAAWKAWQTLWEDEFTDDPPLAAALELVPLEPRRPSDEELAWANDYLASHTVDENLREWTYAREYTLMKDPPAQLELPLQALRIGPQAIIGLPGEVFAEIGIELRDRSPFEATMPVGLANGSVGYVAPDHQMDWGGYECTLCRHVIAPKGTARRWIETAVRLLEQVHAEEG